MIPADVRAGVYLHYRGEYYLVLGLAHHSETMERFVVYVPLYVREGPRMCVRPAEIFFDRVCYTCGSIGSCECATVNRGNRFVYVGAEMPSSDRDTLQ